MAKNSVRKKPTIKELAGVIIEMIPFGCVKITFFIVFNK